MKSVDAHFIPLRTYLLLHYYVFNMTRKSHSELKYPQKSHPRFSVDEAKERIRERQRQNRARRRAERESKEDWVVPPVDRPGAQSRPEISEEEGLETRSNPSEQ